MPLEALSAKARLTVPVGAIDSRWLLRMPCLRIAAFSGSSRRLAKVPASRYLSASKEGNTPFSLPSSIEAA